MPDPTNDIEALIEFLATASQEPFYYTATHNAEKYHAALTALVAERDALWKERDELLKENVALRDRLKAKQDEVLDRVFEMDALRKRVAELEAHPPADRDLSAKIDELSSSVSILMCRVAALESAKFFGPHVPVNPWNPYPTTPWIIYGTRTSDRIEESA